MKIIGLTLNGLNLMIADYFFTIKGLFDFDKNIVTNDLFIDGQSFNRSKINGKVLVLNGIIKTWDPAKIAALNQILYTGGIKPLVANIVGLGVLTAYVEVRSRAEGGDSRKISMQLLMPDPYLYAQNTSTTNLSPVSGSGLNYPYTYPIVYGTVSGGSGSISNAGNAIAYPVITITGACTNPVITNTTTGEAMTLNISLAQTDALVIDCRPATRSIKLNGTTNKIGVKTTASKWPSCQPGVNNLTFVPATTGAGMSCSVALTGRLV